MIVGDFFKPFKNESPQHMILIFEIEQHLRKFTDKIETYRTVKPDIVFHYEPINEFYNQDNLLDYIAGLYCQKRNYLSYFWTALCKLQAQNRIEILRSRRPYLGGVIHEASLVAWRPL